MRNVALPTLLAIATACTSESVGSKNPAAEIETDSSVYRITAATAQLSSVVIVVRFKNISDKVVYLRRCNTDSNIPAYGVFKAAPREKDRVLEGGQEQACPSGVPALAVAPQQERIDTLRLTFDRAAAGDKSGHYVIVYPLLRSPDQIDSDTEASTNVFSLVN